MPEYLCDIVIEAPVGQARIDWGNQPNWLAQMRGLLDTAHTLSLLPKHNNSALPIVTVKLTAGQRWVLFSRVYGHITGPGQIRLYCIGWQMTVNGVNIKSLLWVYPTGVVECAEEPSYQDKLI
jgi:hypothetical protein